MNTPTPSIQAPSDRLIVAGVHLTLTDAMRHHIVLKVGRLLRHQPRIDRILVDVIHDKTRAAGEQFVAKGRVEIAGPDLFASASAGEIHAAINQMIQRLDRALRKRATAFISRHQGRSRARSAILMQGATV